MFIRQTRTNNKATGESYVTYRLVRSERVGGKVCQITVLNLGRQFPIPQEDWPVLCSRLEQLLNPQALLVPLPCAEAIERAAQRYHAQLIARGRRWARWWKVRWGVRRANLAERRTFRKSTSTRSR